MTCQFMMWPIGIYCEITMNGTTTCGQCGGLIPAGPQHTGVYAGHTQLNGEGMYDLIDHLEPPLVCPVCGNSKTRYLEPCGDGWLFLAAQAAVVMSSEP